MTPVEIIEQHQRRVRRCTLCSGMTGPPVTGRALSSPILLVGQAPGSKEIAAGRPFAWTAGKTLFEWFSRIGLDEQDIRGRIYLSAVCRCFPGKNPKGGDRVPNREEIANCSRWLQAELVQLRPQLVLPVGKLAIKQFVPVTKLDEVVGGQQRVQTETGDFDVIALPHPSGASTWHRTEPGKTLLQRALQLIAAHPAWAMASGMRNQEATAAPSLSRTAGEGRQSS